MMRPVCEPRQGAGPRRDNQTAPQLRDVACAGVGARAVNSASMSPAASIRDGVSVAIARIGALLAFALGRFSSTGLPF
jgi:hypothetical protein